MTDKLLTIGLYGASGRMGKSVLELVKNRFRGSAVVVAKLDRSRGVLADLSSADVVIDFSLPDGTSKLLDWFETQTQRLPVYLCGTTGLSDVQHTRMQTLSQRTLVMYATNFFVGAAALSAIVKFASPLLKGLSYQAKVTDIHHIHKIDLPSGTAKVLRDIVDPGGLDDVKIESIQEGEVVGKIDVVFSGAANQITIGINVEDRGLFAQGAIDAALWLNQLDVPSGFYSMETYLQAHLK